LPAGRREARSRVTPEKAQVWPSLVDQPMKPHEVGAPRTAIVDLAQPLGERAVLEVTDGLPVPVTMSA
jgi:hypothetical protein